jgi:hypothetical protein
MYQTATATSKSSYTFNYQAPGLAYQSGPTSGQPFDPQLLPSTRGRKTLILLLVTVVLSLALLVPLVVWLWYIFVQETTTIDLANRVLLSTASATRLLLLSTTSMQVAKAIVGPLMAMHAYVAATDWLASSAQASSSRLPTPIQ